jgi:hypothetical protein
VPVAAAVDFTYRYPFASGVVAEGPALGLQLATCGARHEHPHFFSGRLREPRAVADLLLVLCDVVRTHFFQPRPPLSDPVVTSSEEVLRFEGFSGCCGVYSRVDLPAAAFDREIQGRGTTNVDFNAAMRASLARLRDHSEALLHVGREEVALATQEATVVEKKVKLPVRWIKGLSEVQAYQGALKLRWEVPAAEARRFVRGLPGGAGPKRMSYVVQTGAALRLSQRRQPGGIPLSGTHRLRVLEPILSFARSVRIWCDEASGVSGWEVVLSAGRMLLVLSPEVYRGFSGEGQVLQQLAAGHWQEALPYVQGQLACQSQIDAGRLAARLGLPLAEIDAALAVLGSRGLVGYDLATGRYFHRELPFDLEQVETLQPRLTDARKLLAEQQVAVLADLGGEAFDVEVQGTSVAHHVRLRPEGDRCTCPWFSKHQGQRGPCKHVLAARMLVDHDADTPSDA